MTRVNGSRVLIVEDEYYLATDLSRYFRNMGAVVLGPVACVDSAQEHVHHADAAVLDIDLDGVPVFPLADDLLERGIPFVFYSGRADIALPSRFAHTSLLAKPVETKLVLQGLFGIPHEPEPFGKTSPDDVMACLPRMRLAARVLMEDSAAADRLVELTLERALQEIDGRHNHEALDSWLACLLTQVHGSIGRELLN